MFQEVIGMMAILWGIRHRERKCIDVFHDDGCVELGDSAGAKYARENGAGICSIPAHALVMTRD
jgi:hypothetical protein